MRSDINQPPQVSLTGVPGFPSNLVSDLWLFQRMSYPLARLLCRHPLISDTHISLSRSCTSRPRSLPPSPRAIPASQRRMTVDMNETIGPSLDARLQDAWDKGICSGEVVYSRATSTYEMEDGIPFEARYLPCLDKKPTSRSPSPEPGSRENDGIGEQCEAIEKDKGPRKESTSLVDPFAAPRDNVVLELEEYTCVLNKYALEQGHFLVVTNDFYPQKGLLRPSDLTMIYATLTRPKKRHYCFFNGGVLAGASQEHRHFQFLPVPDLKAPCWPDQIHQKDPTSTAVQSHPNIPAHHFSLPILDPSTKGLSNTFKQLHAAAQKAIGTTDDEMPYNFLMTREYMLLFPRRNEEWDRHQIGVGGTCLIGSIMVTKEKDLDTVKNLGICQILEYVGFPRTKA